MYTSLGPEETLHFFLGSQDEKVQEPVHRDETEAKATDEIT